MIDDRKSHTPSWEKLAEVGVVAVVFSSSCEPFSRTSSFSSSAIRPSSEPGPPDRVEIGAGDKVITDAASKRSD